MRGDQSAQGEAAAHRTGGGLAQAGQRGFGVKVQLDGLALHELVMQALADEGQQLAVLAQAVLAPGGQRPGRRGGRAGEGRASAGFPGAELLDRLGDRVEGLTAVKVLLVPGVLVNEELDRDPAALQVAGDDAQHAGLAAVAELVVGGLWDEPGDPADAIERFGERRQAEFRRVQPAKVGHR